VSDAVGKENPVPFYLLVAYNYCALGIASIVSAA
jgi:hypothetical protein